MFGAGRAKPAKPAALPDKLRTESLVAPEDVLLSASGVPATADSVAYEPVQKLLAVRHVTPCAPLAHLVRAAGGSCMRASAELCKSGWLCHLQANTTAITFARPDFGGGAGGHL